MKIYHIFREDVCVIVEPGEFPSCIRFWAERGIVANRFTLCEKQAAIMRLKGWSVIVKELDDICKFYQICIDEYKRS